MTGDTEAAAVLEKAGRAARRAGALATAVGWLDAAVAMAGDRASISLLLAQAEALLVAGQPGPALAAYREVLAQPGITGGARVEALRMSGRALVMTGDHEGAAVAFGRAAALAGQDYPATAVQVLLDASFSAMISAGLAGALQPATRARNLASSLGPQLRAKAAAAWGEIAVQAGDPAGVSATESVAPWLLAGQAGGLGDGAEADWGSINSFAFTTALVERLAESERAFATLRASADKASQPEALALLADGHGYALTRMGRLDEALEAINAALSLADLVPVVESFAGVGRAYIQLYRGDLDDSAAWCARVEAIATARGEWNALLFVWDVLGHRRWREGAAAEACEHYARLEATVARMGIGEPCLPPWPRHAIGAYLAAGRTGDAERVLAWVDQAAQRLPCRFPKIAAATGRAWLAERAGDRDGAEAQFHAALVLHDEVDLPVDHAETLLAYGAFLCRSGRRAAARPVLARAGQVAVGAGAAGWPGWPGLNSKSPAAGCAAPPRPGRSVLRNNAWPDWPLWGRATPISPASCTCRPAPSKPTSSTSMPSWASIPATS